MKKTVVLLILLLTFVLAACGGQDAATTTEPTAAPAEEMEATEAPPTEAPPTEAPAEEPTAAPAEEAAPTESVVAKLEHVPDPRLVNVTWEWISRDPNGNASPEIVVPNSENYTLFFNEDGTFNATLDCNNGSGVYATPSAGNIFMELGPTTMAACPEDSLAGDMINIFGGAVQSYRLEDNDQTLVMIWVAGGPLDYYRNAAAEPAVEGGEESSEEAAGAAEVEGITAETSNLDLNGLATSYQWQAMPGNPIPQEGPGGQGFPPYILVTFDGATVEEVQSNYQLPRMYIFPIEAYVGMYNAAGNQIVADQVVRLGQLISTADGRTTLPESPMPLLPPPSSFMDRWAQFQDLDFGVGEGVRYVSDSPFRQSIGVWANDTTGYYYQGLTSDQTYYVSLYWPVATAALPNTLEDASEEQKAAANNPDTYPTYKQETIDALNALTAADFSPDLSLLDGMAASLTFPLPGDAPAEEETPEEGDTAEDDEVDLEQPATGEPTATVTAPDGIFVRSGPGTEYPDIGVAATGTSGLITGVSEDRQWWVIEVPVSVAEDQQGWVSASWVDAVNAAGVPVVEAPEVETVEPSLTGVNWQWVSQTSPASGTTAVNDPTRYTVLFNEDSTAAIKADCNNVGASYTADAGSISITLGPSTLAACPEDSLDQQYLASLSNAAVYFFQDGDLYLDLTADGGTMQFTAGDAQAPAPEPTPDPESPTSPASGILFNLVSYGPEGAEQSLIEGTQITATFADQTVSGSAGCNDYTGQITPVNDYFTVGPVALTAKACAEPAGVMEQEQAYLAALQGTAGYEWQQGVAEGGLITGARLFYSLADGTTGFLNFIAQ